MQAVLVRYVPNDPNEPVERISEIPGGNGYPSGGLPIVVGGEVTFAAEGGPIGPLRGCVVHDGQKVLRFYGSGTPITLYPGETLTIEYQPDEGAKRGTSQQG